MSEYFIRLRYFPGDPLEEIKDGDLQDLAKNLGLSISYEKIDHRELKNGLLMENSMDKPIEEISQEVITVNCDQEENAKNGLMALYKKYRCPRTVYSLLGSNEAGRKIATGLMDIYGGW
jgi:hypothetical protein